MSMLNSSFEIDLQDVLDSIDRCAEKFVSSDGETVEGISIENIRDILEINIYVKLRNVENE